jgi:hypothetical protein
MNDEMKELVDRLDAIREGYPEDDNPYPATDRKAFLDWFYEIENYAMRCERFWDEVQHNASPARLDQWLEAAFISGRQSVKTNENE